MSHRLVPSSVFALALLAAVAAAGSTGVPGTGTIHALGSSVLDGQFDGGCHGAGATFHGTSLDVEAAAPATLHLRTIFANESRMGGPVLPMTPRLGHEVHVETRTLTPGMLRILSAPGGVAALHDLPDMEGRQEGIDARVAAQRLTTAPASMWLDAGGGYMYDGQKWRVGGFTHTYFQARWVDFTGTALIDQGVRVYLRDATIVHGDGTYETGPAATVLHEVETPMAHTRAMAYRDAILDVPQASLVLGDGARLACRDVVGTVDGMLRTDGATGRLLLDGEPVEVAGQVLTLAGVFDLNESISYSPSGKWDGRYWTRQEFDGSIGSFGADFQMRPAGPDLLPATLGLAATLVVAVGFAFKNAGSLVGAFYARLGPARVLENPNRRLLYESIHAEPGLDLSELSRRVQFHITTVAYHVQVLRRAGLVGTVRHRRSVRILPQEHLGRGRLPGVLSQVDPQLGFVRELIEEGPRSITEAARVVSERFRVTRRSAYRILARAESRGLVRREGAGKGATLQCPA